MLVNIYGELKEQCPPVNLCVDNIQQVLAGLKNIYGEEVTSHLINNPYYYLLAKKDDPKRVLPLSECILSMSLADYDILYITPEITGEIIAAIIGLVVAIVLVAVMYALSPTPEIDDDPATTKAKDSSLFKDTPNIREEGGSVPFACGESWAGGVLISAGIYSEDA